MKFNKMRRPRDLQALVGLIACWLAFAAGAATTGPSKAEPQDFITVASTTSTQNSGLFAHVLPIFEKDTGIKVRVVAVGTGQAIEIAKRGDADVLLVHHTKSERAFVKDGYGVARHDVMYNDFVIVGPRDDPAEIAGEKDVPAAFARIARKRATFVSRSDNSGTHKREMEIWELAKHDPRPDSGTWYLETGSGMGTALNIAAGKNAYTLTDRGTWLSFKNRGDLRILVEHDKRLFNPYGIILVNPDRHPHVKANAGQTFVDWIISPAGQAAIASYKRNGQQLFHPNAAPHPDTAQRPNSRKN